MRYTTIPIDLMDLTIGHEAQGIDYAIEQGLKTLSEEIGGNPVELVNVAHVIVGKHICVTVMAKPYEPPNAGIFEALKALGWGPETARGTIVKPFMSGVMPL